MLTYIDQVQFLNNLGLPSYLLAAIFVKAIWSRQKWNKVAQSSIVFMVFISICWLPSISIDALYDAKQKDYLAVANKLQERIPILPAVFLYLANNFADQINDQSTSTDLRNMLQTNQFSNTNNLRSAWNVLEEFNQWCYLPAMLELRSESEFNADGTDSLKNKYHTFWQGSSMLTDSPGLYKVCDSQHSKYCQDGALLVPLTITAAAKDDSLSVSCASWWQSDISQKLTRYANSSKLTQNNSQQTDNSQNLQYETSLLYHYLLLIGMQSFHSPFSDSKNWLSLLLSSFFSDAGTYAYSLPLDQYSLTWINSYSAQLGLIQLSLSMTENILTWGKTILLFLLICAPIVGLMVQNFAFISHYWSSIALLTVQPVYNEWLLQSISDNTIWKISNQPPNNWQLAQPETLWQLQLPWIAQLSLCVVVLVSLILSGLTNFLRKE